MTLNADAQELARFSAISARWWDPEGPLRPLHDLNPVRLAFIAERQKLKGARVADIGCGGGILTEALARAGANAIGLDLSGEAIEAARAHALESALNIDYQLLAVEDFAAQYAGSFDALTCMEMLEHVPDPISVLGACAQLLKPGGRLFLSTLNRTPKAFALGIVAAEYVLGLLPRGTHRYERFLKPSELRRGLVGLGLETIEFRGMQYDPLARTASLSDDLSINYLVAAQKAPG